MRSSVVSKVQILSQTAKESVLLIAQVPQNAIKCGIESTDSFANSERICTFDSTFAQNSAIKCGFKSTDSFANSERICTFGSTADRCNSEDLTRELTAVLFAM